MFDYMKTSAEPRDGSDENVVSVDSSMPDLLLNDHLYLFFQKYRKWLILGVILMIGSILVYYGLDLYKKAEISVLQDRYQLVRKDSIKLLDFAETNKGKPLAGLAYLNLADKAYSDGDYNRSENYYLDAIESLNLAVLRNRAQLGLAMALFGGEKMIEGKEVLQFLLDDSTAVSNFRARAGYNLMILLLSEGNKQQAKLIFDEMKVDTGNGSLEQTLWFNRAKSLLD